MSSKCGCIFTIWWRLEVDKTVYYMEENLYVSHPVCNTYKEFDLVRTHDYNILHKSYTNIQGGHPSVPQPVVSLEIQIKIWLLLFYLYGLHFGIMRSSKWPHGGTIHVLACCQTFHQLLKNSNIWSVTCQI